MFEGLNEWVRNRDKAELNRQIGIATGVTAILLIVVLAVPLFMSGRQTWGGFALLASLLLLAMTFVCGYKDM